MFSFLVQIFAKFFEQNASVVPYSLKSLDLLATRRSTRLDRLKSSHNYPSYPNFFFFFSNYIVMIRAKLSQFLCLLKIISLSETRCKIIFPTKDNSVLSNPILNITKFNSIEKQLEVVDNSNCHILYIAPKTRLKNTHISHKKNLKKKFHISYKKLIIRLNNTASKARAAYPINFIQLFGSIK
ncbi:hypothetical protein BpHYR1_000006 [Brachionus plicatilis]|uniref:Uncharacterized protein n=1 Tax=Brachionus plicatilis TaxID=10195 RepID=A0A3M7QZZ2_BRAPC|nr:hypothetical protein BpHYR1_000006 [Brachionus plicatilis]